MNSIANKSKSCSSFNIILAKIPRMRVVSLGQVHGHIFISLRLRTADCLATIFSNLFKIIIMDFHYQYQ